MNKDIVEKGKKIVEELLVDDEDILSKWMGFYIAELMEKAKTKDQKKAKKIKEECARLIIKLWDTKIEKQTISLRQNYYHEMSLKNTPQSKHEIIQKVKNSLENPEKTKKTLSKILFEVLECLSELENSLFRLQIISAVLSSKDSEILDSAKQKFLELELKSHLDLLKEIFPKFTNLSLSNYKSVCKKIAESLKSIYLLRFQLIFEDNKKKG